MVIISKTTLNKFFEQYPSATGPVLQWYGRVKEADWKDFADLRKLFPATDYVGNDLYVFNLGGNNTGSLPGFSLVCVPSIYDSLVHTANTIRLSSPTFKQKSGELPSEK